MGYPLVTKEMTQAFAKAWNFNGIKMILDNTSLQFATDWANIALKSYVDDLIQKALQAKAAKQPGQLQTNAVATQTVPPSAPQKSRIVLTD
jgi:hypothetical protein